MEIGAGDAAVSLFVAKYVQRVTALDVSDTILKDIAAPANVRLLVFDGCEIPVEAGTIDVAYSNQVIEHLHPEDAALQMSSLLRTLKPGGTYLCVTPNRLNGPRHLDVLRTVATGLHMKEVHLPRPTAFRCLAYPVHASGAGTLRCAVWCRLERRLSILPHRVAICAAAFEKLLFASRPVAPTGMRTSRTGHRPSCDIGGGEQSL
jgi:SAM-dependent methyltransferase